MARTWLRLYADTVDNTKLRLLGFEDRWHFIGLLCCKAQDVIDNSRGDMLERALAVKLGLQRAELGELKRRLMEVRLIDSHWQPVGWNWRQFQSDEGSAERVRKHRDIVKRSGNVTRTTEKQPRNADVSEQNRTEQKQNRSEQISEGECEGESRASVDPGTRPAAQPARGDSKPKVKRGSRLDPTREPSEGDATYAAANLPNVDTPALYAQFRDHHCAKGSVMQDWSAAWRTWVRNAIQFGYPMPPAAKLNGHAAPAWNCDRDLQLASAAEALAFRSARSSGKNFASAAEWQEFYRARN